MPNKISFIFNLKYNKLKFFCQCIKIKQLMMSDEELKHSTTSWIPKKNLSKRLEKLPDISSDLDTTDSEREYEDEDEGRSDG